VTDDVVGVITRVGIIYGRKGGMKEGKEKKEGRKKEIGNGGSERIIRRANQSPNKQIIHQRAPNPARRHTPGHTSHMKANTTKMFQVDRNFYTQAIRTRNSDAI
jgi:hypothetical protein